MKKTYDVVVDATIEVFIEGIKAKSEEEAREIAIQEVEEDLPDGKLINITAI